MKYIVVSISLIVLFNACNSSSGINKDKTETEKASVASNEIGENLITFKLNGQPVRTTGWTISRFAYNTQPAAYWLNITSNMKEEKRTINLNLNGSTPGVYKLQGGSVKNSSHGAFYPDYLENLGNSFSFSAGEFTLTGIDTVDQKVNGTFFGTVRNLKGETMQITEGHVVNGKLNPNVIRY